MKWAVVVFPGSNCDEDAAAAIRRVTHDEVDMVWHQQRDLGEYDAIILPGGFSYGDYLRSGAIARFSPVVAGVKDAAEAGKLIVGICNGFQVLTEAGLLPGALLRNDHLQFRCENVALTVQNNQTPFTAAYEVGETIRIPVAHGEGRFYADEETLARLQSNRQIALTYENNPNGSVLDIAGIVNPQGNVLGLMPHPERAVASWMDSIDGVRLFESMHRYVEEVAYVR
jgi:phosphoribosylformylglycinamidine synthase subunit PurQ / glutaminase